MKICMRCKREDTEVIIKTMNKKICSNCGSEDLREFELKEEFCIKKIEILEDKQTMINKFSALSEAKSERDIIELLLSLYTESEMVAMESYPMLEKIKIDLDLFASSVKIKLEILEGKKHEHANYRN